MISRTRWTPKSAKISAPIAYSRESTGMPASFMIILVTRYEDQASGKRLAAEDTTGRFINHTSDDIISFFAEPEMAEAGLTPRRICGIIARNREPRSPVLPPLL